MQAEVSPYAKVVRRGKVRIEGRQVQAQEFYGLDFEHALHMSNGLLGCEVDGRRMGGGVRDLGESELRPQTYRLSKAFSMRQDGCVVLISRLRSASTY
jgi:hypothetical protein